MGSHEPSSQPVAASIRLTSGEQAMLAGEDGAGRAPWRCDPGARGAPLRSFPPPPRHQRPTSMAASTTGRPGWGSRNAWRRAIGWPCRRRSTSSRSTGFAGANWESRPTTLTPPTASPPPISGWGRCRASPAPRTSKGFGLGLGSKSLGRVQRRRLRQLGARRPHQPVRRLPRHLRRAHRGRPRRWPPPRGKVGAGASSCGCPLATDPRASGTISIRSLGT
jgi:hypothetical protein